jgi:Peptidase family S41
LNSELVSSFGIMRGDELVALDNELPDDIAKKLSKFVTLGSETADQRFLARFMTVRSTQLPPASLRSWVKFKTARGEVIDINLSWLTATQDRTSARRDLPVPRLTQMRSEIGIGASVSEFGAPVPYFASALHSAGAAKLTITNGEWAEAIATDPSLKDKKPYDIFAVLYRHENKNVLLMRVPNYTPENDDEDLAVATYRLLLRKYQPLADVLVLDQTHNPGGSVSYVEKLASLFVDNAARGFMFAPRADRLWLRDLSEGLNWSGIDAFPTAKQAMADAYEIINAAQERGDFLAAPISFGGTFTLPAQKVWDKPILLLIDDLCASGGDAFPMIMKGNGRATVFGRQTIGAGGNVSEMSPLPNSGAQIQLTRSLFYLTRLDDHLPDNVIENQGVSPDITFDPTVEDFRANFSGYVSAFSSAAAALVK